MKIKEVLDSKKVSISFEIFPPKKQSSFDSVMNAALNLCSLQPDFMSVTYGAGGSTKGKTTEIANKLQSNGNTVSLAHLTCVGSSKEDINKKLMELTPQRIAEVSLRTIEFAKENHDKQKIQNNLYQILRRISIN